MKHLQLTAFALMGAFFVSCAPRPVYVPVYVPIRDEPQIKATPKKIVYRAKPKPSRPVESAEGFRAVDKPTTYSN